MAETIVNLVLERITNALVKEVLHLCGVGEQVQKIERELNWIKAFLKDADRKQITDEIQKEWVKEVREVAYSIEDVIDTFLCEVPQKKPGKREAIKRMFQKTKKLPIIHKLGDEINQILARLQEIYDKKVRFGINSLGEVNGGGKKLPVRPPVLPDIDDPDVVGLDVDRDNIVKELLDKNTPRRSVVSIVGPGGLGKTTLAKKVYNSNEVQRTFDIRIWVAISQEFKLINVLRKIIGMLRRIDESEQGKDEEYFLMELYHSLKEKKYLLTIDDVWTTNLWMTIEKALPNENNGSKILMTTRIFEVAKEADSAREPYKLSFLTEESSLELFLKRALLNREIQNRCPNDLFGLAKEFVKKCDGLPLALVVLGGLLAKKQPTYVAWSKVMQTMNWNINEQKVCLEIIGTSYDDLPLALKSCFMYFAAFPEDYTIEVEPLLHMWIAEGFISHEENRTLKDTAESFLEDIVQRSMVQVSERSLHNDSIISCRIHDLLRDVAIKKAKEDNFLRVCSNEEQNQSCGEAHRVAVHNSDCNEMIKYASPNLRTLLGFNSPFPNNCSRHRLLKVLSDNFTGLKYADIRHHQVSKTEWFEVSHQLRYLQLTEGSFLWDSEAFNKLIGTMKFLQTLNLEQTTASCQLPDCIWHITTLRHVLLPDRKFTLGPPPSVDLKNLQTLQSVKSRESWKPTSLPRVLNLRLLNIEVTEGFSWELIVAFFNKLEKLAVLLIKGRDIPIEVVDMRGFPFYQQLTSLTFWGSLSGHHGEMPFDVAMFPNHLTKLTFEGSNLLQGHLAVLENLQSLKLLELIKAYSDNTMRCSTRGFPCLQDFKFTSKRLQNWEIEEGAMPKLKKLCVDVQADVMLQVPPGLQHLSTLCELTWTEYSRKDWYYQQNPSICATKAQEIRNICKHVPSITIYGLER